MLRPYLKIWVWDLIFGHAVEAIFSPAVRSPWWQGRRHVDGGIDFNVTLELDSYYKISLKKVP